MNRFVHVILVLMITIGSMPFSTAHAVENVTYTFGVVPQFDTRQTLAVWEPLLAELEQRTGFNFRLQGSSSIPKFEAAFMDGDFDFAYMNPYQVLKASESQGYVPMVRDIGRSLFGVLVVRKDGVVKDIADLTGKKIAFPAPNAVGATLVMRADLKHIHKIDVVPVYVKSHSSVYLNVVMGEADAGGGVQKTLSQQPLAVRSNLRVIYKTRDITPHPVTAHSRVPASVRESVRLALLALGESKKGQALLSAVPINKIGDTNMGDYKPLGEWGLDEFYVSH